MADYSVHIVVDNGANTTKAGFNGENAPRAVIPTVIGEPKSHKSLISNIINDPSKIYVGREALYNSANLKLTSAIKNGIMDVDKMEQIWSHIFTNELKIKPEAHNVFLTESLHNSNEERRKIAEIMFEKFSIFNINIEPQEVMTLFTTPRISGLIVESGEGMTEVVPVFEGYIIPQGIRYNNIAGETMTLEFLDRIRDKLKKHNVGNMFETAKKIKEKFAEVSLDGNFNGRTDSAVLPDGNIISIGDERYTVPEAIFNPEIINSDCLSIQNMVRESINNVDIHLRKDFISNIVLCGGNTLIKNFNERLMKELVGIYDKGDEGGVVKINAQDERLYSSWVGASIACSIGNFQQMWISKNEYEEVGPNIINKKYSY